MPSETVRIKQVVRPHFVIGKPNGNAKLGKVFSISPVIDQPEKRLNPIKEFARVCTRCCE